MKSDSTIQVGSVQLKLSEPLNNTNEWIGQREILNQLLACWLVVDEQDLPLTPRLVGVPGIGKTALAMAAAGLRGQDLYVFQCTADTRPEDLLVTPVLSHDGKIAYHASPLVTAMLRGGVRAGRRQSHEREVMGQSGATARYRRYVESIVAGVVLHAHRDFRCAVTMNQDDSTYEIPDYILSRLQPTLPLGFPTRQDELAILQYHLPFAGQRCWR